MSDTQDLRLRRYINYDPITKQFAVTINFGGIVAVLNDQHTTYLAAEEAYNLWLTKCEAIFANLAEASKLSFRNTANPPQHGTVDVRTLAVAYDVSLEESPQSDEMPEADETELYSEEEATELENWQIEAAQLEKEIHDDELQDLAKELRHDDSEDSDKPYEPYERIRTDYDPIRYE